MQPPIAGTCGGVSTDSGAALERSLFERAERLGCQEPGGWRLCRLVKDTSRDERHSKASVVSVARPALPPLSGLILSCKWLTASALIDHSSCSSVVPGGLKLYS